MRKLFSCLLLAFVLLISGMDGPGETITSPAVWLRADQGALTPGLWTDESGNERHATALSGEGPEEEALLNFNKALIFDGLDDYMQIPYSVEGLPEITILAVFQSADTTERGIWVAEKAVSRKIMLTTRRAAGPDEQIDTYGKNEKLPVLHTLVQHWSEAETIGQEAFLAIGSSGREQDSVKHFKGLLAELLVFDKNLSFLERLQYQTYLAIKYGLPLKESNYVSSAEEVLWKWEDQAEYAHRITGIGRDDAFKLYQKQARSAMDTSSLLLMSAGQPQATNAENTAVIPNQDFLVWGDNNGVLSDTLREEQEHDTLLAVLERRWLMDATGNTAHQLPIELQLNRKELANDSTAYWLLLDRSARNDFSLDNVEIVLADSVTGDSLIVYRNLHWDTDASGKDMFSLARAKYMVAQIAELNHPNCDSLFSGSAAFQVVGGQGPFRYTLSNPVTGFVREWKGETTFKQDSLEAGDYKLRVQDVDGFEVNRTFSLRLPNTLLVDLGDDRSLAAGNEMMLDAGEFIPDSIPVSYAWESSYGFKSSEAQISIRESGIYRVTVSNAEGCLFSDEVVVSGAVARRFEVFPNPIQPGKAFSIGVSLKEAGPVSLRIYNLSGYLYEQLRADNSTEYQFKASLKEAGMYMIMLDTPEGTESKRIVVQ